MAPKPKRKPKRPKLPPCPCGVKVARYSNSKGERRCSRCADA